jgi:phosphoribosyl-AMP cyclohydrolase
MVFLVNYSNDSIMKKAKKGNAWFEDGSVRASLWAKGKNTV